MIGSVSATVERSVPMDDSPRPGDEPLGVPADVVADANSSFALILRAKAGDDDALETLCERYLPRLQRWAHGRLPRSVRGALDTHDLVQVTLTGVVQQLHAFEPRHEGAFQAYVRRALLNRIRDEARRGLRRGPSETLDAAAYQSADSSPLEDLIGRETLERYEAAMERLRPADSEAIIARVELGLSYPEVAAALGKPSVAAAHMAVSRALVRLAQEMSRVKS
jgi:RNA polymerase sigma factor (sigma-70 family)